MARYQPKYQVRYPRGDNSLVITTPVSGLFYMEKGIQGEVSILYSEKVSACLWGLCSCPKADTKPNMRVDTKASVSFEVDLMYCIFIHLPAGMLNSDWLTKVFTLECDNPPVITSPVSGLHQTVNH